MKVAFEDDDDDDDERVRWIDRLLDQRGGAEQLIDALLFVARLLLWGWGCRGMQP